MRSDFRSVLYRRDGRPVLEVRGKLDASAAAGRCARLQAMRFAEGNVDVSRLGGIDAPW